MDCIYTEYNAVLETFLATKSLKKKSLVAHNIKYPTFQSRRRIAELHLVDEVVFDQLLEQTSDKQTLVRFNKMCHEELQKFPTREQYMDMKNASILI